MWPTVSHVVKLVKAGVFTAQDFGGFSYMGKGGSYLAPYHVWEASCPPTSRTWSPSAGQEIIDGNFRVDVDESTPVSD